MLMFISRPDTQVFLVGCESRHLCAEVQILNACCVYVCVCVADIIIMLNRSKI